MKISAVENQVSVLSVIDLFFRELMQPMVFYACNLGFVVARDLTELSYRIPFANPEFKPALFSKSFV